MAIDATKSMDNDLAEEPENTLRADLEAAYEASENESSIQQPESGSSEKPDAGGDSSEDGAADKDIAAISGGEGSEKEQHGSDAGEIDGPPVSLSPEAREAWKTTPKAMQTAITEREREYTVGLQKHADNAARAQVMDQALEPYRQYMAVAGGPPAQIIGNLLQTASILQMGSPVQRAQQVAALITQFGVNIDSLAAALDGVAQPEGVQRNTEVTTAINTALKPYQQMLQQQQEFQRNQAQQGQQVVNDDIAAFGNDAKNEFYNDVKMDMADIFDLADKRNIAMDMPEAYRRACLLRPDIQAIVTARAGQQLVDKRRVAGSSIRGAPGGGGGADSSLSRREALSAAWDESARQG